MTKLLMAFIAVFMILSIISAIADGGGWASTHITTAIDNDDVSVEVDSTTGFLTNGVLFMQSEKVPYTGTDATHFTGLVRGYEDTTAKGHDAGVQVYCEDIGVINAALGFDVGTVAATNGWISVISIPWHFFSTTLPRLMLWNYSFFDGDLLSIVRWILVAISIALPVAFIAQVLGPMITSILKR